MLRRTTYGSAVIEYTLLWSNRRVLSISVDINGVTVAAPEGEALETVDQRVKRRARWILRQQRRFAAFKPVTPPRLYIGGETHRYLGRQYRLKIDAATDEERVRLHAGRIRVESHRPGDTTHTRELLETWFRQRAREVLHERFLALASFAVRLGVGMPPLRICTMTKRWGSLTPSGRVLLNDRLIAANRDCIDYVILHELCHIAEPNHSPRFYRLLSRHMPDWKVRKSRLDDLSA